VVDLIVNLYRLQMLPDSFCKALDGDGEVRGPHAPRPAAFPA
jgi:hypothetical protein